MNLASCGAVKTVARLHLVDGTYELFRAHFSKRPGHLAPNGSDVKATLGVASSLLALLQSESEAVTHLAVAFDNPIRSFRNRLFPGYKTEEGVERALAKRAGSVLRFSAMFVKRFPSELTRALGLGGSVSRICLRISAYPASRRESKGSVPVSSS